MTPSDTLTPDQMWARAIAGDQDAGDAPRLRRSDRSGHPQEVAWALVLGAGTVEGMAGRVRAQDRGGRVLIEGAEGAILERRQGRETGASAWDLTLLSVNRISF